MLDANVVIVSGSSDGVLTTAGFLNLLGKERAKKAQLVFSRPWQMDKINFEDLPVNSRIAFINFAACNAKRRMAERSVKRLVAAGHKIVAVVDEHNRLAWRKVLVRNGVTFDELSVRPQTQGRKGPKSSGAVLLRHIRARPKLLARASPQCLDLLQAADQADRLNFDTPYGNIANRVIKVTSERLNWRLCYLAQYLAFNQEPDPLINEWMREYDQLEKNSKLAVRDAEQWSESIVHVDIVGRRVDRSWLIGRLFKRGAGIVALTGRFFSTMFNRWVKALAFQARERQVNLRPLMERAGIVTLGGGQRILVECQEREAAVSVLKARGF